jgi:septal ring factor EnvC (AmiA/AmiB activator)
MPRPSGSKAGRLTAEERQLEQIQEELLRKQQELKRRLERLPVALAEKEDKRRKQRAQAAGPAISPNFGRPTGKRPRRGNRSMITPSRERWLTKLKTFGWLLILGIIVFMLLKVIPTH